MNIRDRLLELGHWEEAQRTFRGAKVWSQSEAILVEIEGPSIFDDQLDADLRGWGLPIRDVWFLSKHAAASGTPSFTVHPIGNPGEAKFGGKPGTFSPAAPRDMGALLRRLRVHATAANLPHQVTYEATHHGPHLSFPALFVEIGSEDAWYRDEAGGRVVAQAVQDVLTGIGRSRGPVWLGVGGGHYAPRATDIARSGEADFGHLLPNHALEAAADPVALLRTAYAATPGCVGVHLHRKGMKGALYRTAMEWMSAAELPEAVRIDATDAAP